MPSFKYELARRAHRARRAIVQLSKIINPRQIRCKRHCLSIEPPRDVATDVTHNLNEY